MKQRHNDEHEHCPGCGCEIKTDDSPEAIKQRGDIIAAMRATFEAIRVNGGSVAVEMLYDAAGDEMTRPQIKEMMRQFDACGLIKEENGRFVLHIPELKGGEKHAFGFDIARIHEAK